MPLTFYEIKCTKKQVSLVVVFLLLPFYIVLVSFLSLFTKSKEKKSKYKKGKTKVKCTKNKEARLSNFRRTLDFYLSKSQFHKKKWVSLRFYLLKSMKTWF